MKTFSELSPAQQKAAVSKCATVFLKDIIDGGLRFDDELNHDDLQARIDAACQRANDMQTPWFAHEYIMDTCKEEIEGLASCAAEDALYSELGENIICGIADKEVPA